MVIYSKWCSCGDYARIVKWMYENSTTLPSSSDAVYACKMGNFSVLHKMDELGNVNIQTKGWNMNDLLDCFLSAIILGNLFNYKLPSAKSIYERSQAINLPNNVYLDVFKWIAVDQWTMERAVELGHIKVFQ